MSWGELSDEDRPGQEIWMDDRALEKHFAAVKERWEARGKGGGGEDEEYSNSETWTDNEVVTKLKRRSG